MARKTYDYLFKILLLGDSAVGKTCLIFRFCDNSFRESFIATIGIDFKIKTVEIGGKKVRLQVWDTAGQERFHTITISYYRNAHAVLLVYDITRQQTFENILNWVRQVRQHAKEHTEMMLVGNKCDLGEYRQVLNERAKQLSLDYGMPFIESSAKTGENVEKMFLDIAVALINNPHFASASSNRLPLSNAISIEQPESENRSDSKLFSYAKCC